MTSVQVVPSHVHVSPKKLPAASIPAKSRTPPRASLARARLWRAVGDDVGVACNQLVPSHNHVSPRFVLVLFSPPKSTTRA